MLSPAWYDINTTFQLLWLQGMTYQNNDSLVHFQNAAFFNRAGQVYDLQENIAKVHLSN